MAAQVLVNGDFEGGETGGVPNGWTKATWTTYSCRGYTADWRLFSSTMNNYPPLDVYAGDKSLGVFRTDGSRCDPVSPNMAFYEYNVLYQNIPVELVTRYYVRCSAAVFTHHDRAGDLEDFWGSGVAVRICRGANSFLDADVVWEHGFWNWEGDSFWRYYPELRNQKGGEQGRNYIDTSFYNTVTFSIIWLTKWDVDMDLCAIDNVQLDLFTGGPEPPGSDTFTAKSPPTWSDPDPIWEPTEKPWHWCKAGATNGGDQLYQSLELTTGMYPTAAATGDFNSDGLLDIAVISEWSHLISVYLQKPDGGFGLGAHMGGTIYPRSIQACQIVGSPAVDLAVCSAGTREVAVFPGNGDGSFATPYRLPVSLQPSAVACGDLNFDGYADLVVGGIKAGSNGEVWIYVGDGLGGFSKTQTLTGIQDTKAIFLVDFGDTGAQSRPDGLPDLAVLRWQGTVVVYRGWGNGYFGGDLLGQPADTIPHQSNRWKSFGLAIANFSADPYGIPDICVPYMWEHNWAQILTGNGNCTFIRQASEDMLRPSMWPSCATALDYNRDGRADLAFSNYASPNCSLYQNRGYTPPALYDFPYIDHYGVGNTNTSVVTRDMNADGYDDLLITSGATQTANIIFGGPNGALCAPSLKHSTAASCAGIGDFVVANPRNDLVIAASSAVVYRNDGGMQFTQVYSSGLTGRAEDVAVADFNPPSSLDFAVLRVGSSGGAAWCYVYTGDGAGSFSQQSLQMDAATATLAQDMVVADFDGVNGPDLAIAEAQSAYEGIYCRLNNGAGSFAWFKSTSLPSGSLPRDLEAGDFNGDGKQDVVVALAAMNKFGLLTGKGNGFFNTPITFGTGAEPTGVCAADFNTDAKPDVAISNKGDDTVRIFLGDGAGSFLAGQTIGVGDAPTHLYACDLNADGKTDIAVANSVSQTFSLLRGNGDGTFQPQQEYRTGGTPIRFAAGDLRETGLPDLFVGNNWEIFRNSLLSTGGITVSDDGATQSYTDHINGSWLASTSGGRSIVRYRWAVSTTPDTSGIIPAGGWVYTTATSGTRNINLTPGTTYYVLAQAEDSANLWTAVGSADGILVRPVVSVSTPAQAKAQPDGQGVILTGVIVSAVWPGEPWVCYVQDLDRASGIRVQGSGSAPTVGSQVTVTGMLTSLGPERMIADAETSATGNPGEPAPLALVSKALGGGDFNYQLGPPVRGQAGVSGGFGVNNIGLLVRASGRVTEIGSDCFWIDDGPGLAADVGHVGVRVVASGIQPPQELQQGAYALVTGVSSCAEIAGGTVIRRLLPRTAGDITIIQGN